MGRPGFSTQYILGATSSLYPMERVQECQEEEINMKGSKQNKCLLLYDINNERLRVEELQSR